MNLYKKLNNQNQTNLQSNINSSLYTNQSYQNIQNIQNIQNQNIQNQNIQNQNI